MTIGPEEDETISEQDELDAIDREIEEIDAQAAAGAEEMLLGRVEEPEPIEELDPESEIEPEESEEPEEEEPVVLGGGGRGSDGKPVPVYLLDDPPEGKTNLIKWSLMHDLDEEYLKTQGFNTRSIDICAQELEKSGLRKRPKKTTTAVAKSGSRAAQIFAKGSPPEALIDALEIPGLDGKLTGFDQGMRFGASVIVLGVRIVQELSSLGVQQTKPLIDVANSMRAGEALAAKTAANEAAAEAAGRVQASMMPALAALQKGTDGADPVKAMMVRTMEPMIQGMMKSLMPGMPQGETSGWTRKQVD